MWPDANDAGHTAVRGYPERKALRGVTGADGAAVSSPYSAIRESLTILDARAMVTLRNRLAGVSNDYHSCEAPRCGMPVADA